ncbi:MAG: MFS transporter [Microbacterium sp.]
MRRARLLIVITQIAAMTSWFSASAVSDQLAVALDAGDNRGLLTSAVQLGFVVGALASAALNLPDRVSASRLYGLGALAAALMTVLVAVVADTLAAGVALRFLTGVALATVYPVGLKLMASWATPAERARAIGFLVGGLTVGSALPQLIRGFSLPSWQLVLLVAAAVTAMGGVVALWAIRVGPNVLPAAGALSPDYALRMFAERLPRLANVGYLGHMWELYALWAWMPAFLVASVAAHGSVAGPGVHTVAFVAIGLAGFVGCVVGGWAADRYGRGRAAAAALVVSGACCLLSPLLFVLPLPALAVAMLVWGAAVIADSGVFSTALSEVADPRRVGTALTAQTAYGFLLTIVSIQGVELLAGVVTWQYAFVVLAVGPAIGAVAMIRYARSPRPAHSRPLLSTHRPSPLREDDMKQILPGATASLERVIGDDDIALFTRISGDHNPLHYDAEAARASRFGEIVVQGGVTSAILNAVVAEQLPGPGTVFLNVNWDFKAPVRPGDTIRGEVEVMEARTDKPIVKLATRVVRGDGVVVLDGTAVTYTMDIE